MYGSKKGPLVTLKATAVLENFPEGKKDNEIGALSGAHELLVNSCGGGFPAIQNGGKLARVLARRRKRELVRC
jgi:hypothetical protein